MSRRKAAPTLPKVCGGDLELGNFIAGTERFGGTGPEASRILLQALAEVTDGVPADPWLRGAGGRVGGGAAFGRFNPQDSGRVFLPCNGGCAYIDLDHLELCLPEVVSAYDHVAAWHAMLRLAQAALAHANADRSPDRRVEVLVNNSDGQGNSYGGHLNILLARAAWEGVMHRRLHHLAFLASYQASSLVFTGQGKVGSENDAPAPPTNYQISQRADFIETLLGPQTTFYRPLVNTRDEPHSDQGRLHLISFDSTLAQTACLLRVGVTQMVLALIEADRVNPRLALDDPLAALHDWSHDPGLRRKARLVSGRRVTAVEHQLLLLEEARRFEARGGFQGIVPRAGEVLDLWQDTLERLARRDWAVLARRLDWVMKLAILERALAQRPDLTWTAPEVQHLDQLYGGLDPGSGLFWAWSRSGLVDEVVPPERIRHFCEEPPADTRAWGRAMLLRQAGPDPVRRVDWDSIEFRLFPRRGRSGLRRIRMPNPLGANRREWGARFAPAPDLEELLEGLGAEPGLPALGYRVGPGPVRVAGLIGTGPAITIRQHGGQHE